MSPRTARIRSLRPLRRASGTPCTGSARTRMSPPRRPGGPRCLGVPMGSRRGRTRSSQDVSGHTIVGLPGELPVRRARSRVTSISCRNGQRDSDTIRRSPRSCPRDRRDRGSSPIRRFLSGSRRCVLEVLRHRQCSEADPLAAPLGETVAVASSRRSAGAVAQNPMLSPGCRSTRTRCGEGFATYEHVCRCLFAGAPFAGVSLASASIDRLGWPVWT